MRFPDDMRQTPEYNRTGRQHTAFAGLAASGMTVVFDNMMDGTACVTGNAPWRWLDIITDLGMRQADIAHQSDVVVIRTLADIHDAHRTGKVGLLFGLEAATPIENEIDRLDVLYGLGLRQIGIAYSDANALGSGLNETGRRRPDRLRQAGGRPDEPAGPGRRHLALLRPDRHRHLLASASARLHDARRSACDLGHAADEVRRRPARRGRTGGVIGMSAAPHTTLSHAHPRHTILSVMDHFRYCLDLVGIEHVAFGPDTLYGDHVGLHTVFGHLLKVGAAAPGGPPSKK